MKGQSAGMGRMHGSCRSSCGTWCWQSSEQGRCSDPQPQGFGSTASWPVSFPALCLSSTALDLPPCCPQWWLWHEELPQGLARLCPCSPHLASFRAVCGAGLGPSHLHCRLSASPGSSRGCAGSSPWPRPCCSSGLALGLVLLSLCQGHPRCAGHQPGISHVRVLCHVLCASIVCLRVSCVPAACPMSPQHVWCPCVLTCGWRGCLLSELWFGSLAPPGSPEVAVVNVPVGHCVFMSAPSCGRALVVSAALHPLGSSLGRLGTYAGRVCGLCRCPGYPARGPVASQPCSLQPQG